SSALFSRARRAIERPLPKSRHKSRSKPVPSMSKLRKSFKDPRRTFPDDSIMSLTIMRWLRTKARFRAVSVPHEFVSSSNEQNLKLQSEKKARGGALALAGS